MRLLALETATIEVGASIVVDGEVAAAVTTRPGRRHAETLHPAIEAACALSGVALGALDAVAVDVGPGLFTGLRVGIAAAKALGFGLGLPVVACTSLEVLHHAARGREGAVAAVVDMRRGELAFSLRPAGSPPLAAGPVALAGLEGLVAALAAVPGPVLCVGDGARRHEARLAGLAAAGGTAVAGAELGAPPAASLGLLAADRLASGGGLDPFAVEPVYLRPVDARINWSTRDGAAAASLAGEAG